MTRRGFFALLAGAALAPKLAKAAPAFTHGGLTHGGLGFFGRGQLAILHGHESILPLRAMIDVTTMRPRGTVFGIPCRDYISGPRLR